MPFRGGCFTGGGMAKMDPDQMAELEFQTNLRRALATPPISNNDILKRSKDRRERAETRPRSQQ